MDFIEVETPLDISSVCLSGNITNSNISVGIENDIKSLKSSKSNKSLKSNQNDTSISLFDDNLSFYNHSNNSITDILQVDQPNEQNLWDVDFLDLNNNNYIDNTNDFNVLDGAYDIGQSMDLQNNQFTINENQHEFDDINDFNNFDSN